MVRNRSDNRLYVTNSDDDTISVIDTIADKKTERVRIGLSDGHTFGSTPLALALSDDGHRLYVADSDANTVATVILSPNVRGMSRRRSVPEKSRIVGFIPTAHYPSAMIVANGALLVSNGRANGFENPLQIATDTGCEPNVANSSFPVGQRTVRYGKGGQYVASLDASTISLVPEPTASS